jgi:hypothetical protein
VGGDAQEVDHQAHQVHQGEVVSSDKHSYLM